MVGEMLQYDTPDTVAAKIGVQKTSLNKWMTGGKINPGSYEKIKKAYAEWSKPFSLQQRGEGVVNQYRTDVLVKVLASRGYDVTLSVARV